MRLRHFDTTPFTRRYLTPELYQRIAAARPLDAKLRLDAKSPEGPFTASVDWLGAEVARAPKPGHAPYTELEAAVLAVLDWRLDEPVELSHIHWPDRFGADARCVTCGARVTEAGTVLEPLS